VLLKRLKIERADVFGYSMGGNVALALAIRHSNMVGLVAINGDNFAAIEEAYEPETFEQFKSLPADFAPRLWRRNAAMLASTVLHRLVRGAMCLPPATIQSQGAQQLLDFLLNQVADSSKLVWRKLLRVHDVPLSASREHAHSLHRRSA
jgi:pimeloyl-ACP methyl ester carboxylesterase